MFAAIYIPDFPVEAIVRAEPELREQAVAVVEGAPPLVHVVAVNERAAQAGIEPGMTKLQAEAMLVDIQRSVLDRQQPIAGTVRERAAEREAAAHAALLDSACGFSPRVEDTAVDTVVLDIAGLERIFGPPARMAREVARRCSEMGLEANVAVASNADTAVLAARGFAGVTVVPEGKEAERLGELGVEILASPHWAAPKWSEKDPRTREGACATNAREILETLERWGVRNLRALATLPAVAVAERLGQHGLYLQKLARGEMQRALVVAEPPLVFEEAAELDYPVEMLEPLAFVLNRMLEQLCARLAARALATNELKLMLMLDTNVEDRAIGRSGDRVIEHPAAITGSPDNAITRCLRLPVPMLDAKVFLKLLQLDLQAHPPQAPVAKVRLRAEPAEPRRAQNGLFVPEAPEPEKLELTIARINKVVGTSSALRVASPERNPQSAIGNRDGSPARVGSPQVVDTHAAEGWRMKPFVATGGHAAPTQNGTREGACDTQATVALRVFRPALHAVVTLRDGLPAHVASPERPAMRGEVVWCAGPWRSSGEWWSQQAWSRAEWDVAVKNEESVVLYRIYRDEIGGKWWVEGSYD